MPKETGKRIFGQTGLLFFDDGNGVVGIKMQTSIETTAPKEVKQAIYTIADILENAFPEVIKSIAIANGEVKIQ